MGQVLTNPGNVVGSDLVDIGDVPLAVLVRMVSPIVRAAMTQVADATGSPQVCDQSICRRRPY